MEKNPIKSTRKILTILFLLIGIIGVFASVFLIWMTGFGIGWGGGESSLFDVIWMWKGLLLFAIYSTLAGYGLIKNKKIGILFGLVTSICLISYFIFQFVISIIYGVGLKFGEVIKIILFIVLTSFIIIGLYKMTKTIGTLNKYQYLLGGILILIVVLSFVFMFD